MDHSWEWQPEIVRFGRRDGSLSQEVSKEIEESCRGQDPPRGQEFNDGLPRGQTNDKFVLLRHLRNLNRNTVVDIVRVLTDSMPELRWWGRTVMVAAFSVQFDARWIPVATVVLISFGFREADLANAAPVVNIDGFVGVWMFATHFQSLFLGVGVDAYSSTYSSASGARNDLMRERMVRWSDGIKRSFWDFILLSPTRMLDGTLQKCDGLNPPTAYVAACRDPLNKKGATTKTLSNKHWGYHMRHAYDAEPTPLWLVSLNGKTFQTHLDDKDSADQELKYFSSGKWIKRGTRFETVD